MKLYSGQGSRIVSPVTLLSKGCPTQFPFDQVPQICTAQDNQQQHPLHRQKEVGNSLVRLEKFQTSPLHIFSFSEIFPLEMLLRFYNKKSIKLQLARPPFEIILACPQILYLGKILTILSCCLV